MRRLMLTQGSVLNQSSTSFLAWSLARPYRSWILPSSWSRRPFMTSRSSSVRLPHFSLILPFICFQFPSTRFQSIRYLLYLLLSFDGNNSPVPHIGTACGVITPKCQPDVASIDLDQRPYPIFNSSVHSPGDSGPLKMRRRSYET